MDAISKINNTFPTVNIVTLFFAEQSGNYTCGPSNTKSASVRLHIVDSKYFLTFKPEVHIQFQNSKFGVACLRRSKPF